MAGLTVGVMAVPQSLSYARVAGLAPERGMYASFVALMVYAALGGSPHLISGPSAVLAIMLRSAVPEEWQDVELLPDGSTAHALAGNASRALSLPAPGAVQEAGMETYISAATMLTFFAGGLQLLLASLGLGMVFQLIAAPVVAGFTSGAAFIIAGTQFSAALGLDKCSLPDGGRCHFTDTLVHVLQRLPQARWPVALTTLACLALLLVLKVFIKPALPARWKPAGNLGPLCLMLVLTPIMYAIPDTMHTAGLRAVGSIPQGLPAAGSPFRVPTAWTAAAPGRPFFTAQNIGGLVAGSIAVAAVGFLEAFTISKVVARKARTGRLNTRQELIAMGCANCAASLTNGFAVTGSFSRTAVNVDAGATSHVSGLVAGLTVGLACLVLTPVLAYLPEVALASIILVAVTNLVEVKEALTFWKANARDFAVFAVVFVASLVLGIDVGLAAGLVVSFLLTLTLHHAEPMLAVLLQVARDAAPEQGCVLQGTPVLEPGMERLAQILVLRVPGDLTFAGSERLQEAIEEGLDTLRLEAIVLDLATATACDASAVMALRDALCELSAAENSAKTGGGSQKGQVTIILGNLAPIMLHRLQHTLSFLRDADSDELPSSTSTAGVELPEPDLKEAGVVGFRHLPTAISYASLQIASNRADPLPLAGGAYRPPSVFAAAVPRGGTGLQADHVADVEPYPVQGDTTRTWRWHPSHASDMGCPSLCAQTVRWARSALCWDSARDQESLLGDTERHPRAARLRLLSLPEPWQGLRFHLPRQPSSVPSKGSSSSTST